MKKYELKSTCGNVIGEGVTLLEALESAGILKMKPVSNELAIINPIGEDSNTKVTLNRNQIRELALELRRISELNWEYSFDTDTWEF